MAAYEVTVGIGSRPFITDAEGNALDLHQVAEELNRLHAENEQLRRACDLAAAWFEGQMPSINSVLRTSWPYQAEYDLLCAALGNKQGGA